MYRFNLTTSIPLEIEQTSIPSSTTASLVKLLNTDDPVYITSRNLKFFIGVLGCFFAILFACFSCAFLEIQNGCWFKTSVMLFYIYCVFFVISLVIMICPVPVPVVGVGSLWLVFFVMPTLTFAWYYFLIYFPKRHLYP